MTDEEKRVRNRAAVRKWKASNKAQQVAYRRDLLLSKYGLNQDQFDDMLSSQNYTCAICGTEEPEGRHNIFHIDHCHTTQRVRGLLCNLCNVGLGAFKDSPAALRTAATYIEGHAQ